MQPILIPAIAEDGSLFPIEKMEAHLQGQLHLAISVFVFSPKGELLIQRRAASKYHCGGMWANTCCSHPNWQEEVSAAADRRMDEELGVYVHLNKIGVVEYRAAVGQGLIEHERVHMFSGTADPASLALKPNPDEVDETRWVSLAWLKTAIEKTSEDFSPWFKLYVERWQDVWAPAA
ncbi:MAG: isopentenyl-diphosphate Delta-isomerase [Pseudomonadota bacterium]